jgi:hypothetical protein
MSVTRTNTTNGGTYDKEDCVYVHQFKYVSFCWSNRKRNGGEENQSNHLIGTVEGKSRAEDERMQKN